MHLECGLSVMQLHKMRQRASQPVVLSRLKNKPNEHNVLGLDYTWVAVEIGTTSNPQHDSYWGSVA